MKNCNTCGELKSLEEYHKHPHNVDGRVSKCKSCTKIYNKKYNATEPRKAAAREQNRKRTEARRRKAAGELIESTYGSIIISSESVVGIDSNLPLPNKKDFIYPEGSKCCTMCGESKTYNNYYRRKYYGRNTGKRDGFYSRCKACVSKYNEEKKNNEPT